MKHLWLLAAWLVLSWSSGASAASIPGLFNTGVDALGAQLGIGSVDPHYFISGPFNSIDGPFEPVVAALIREQHPAWVNSSHSAQWIGPNVGDAGGTFDDPDGDYEYNLTFDLTGLDHTTAILTGSWAVDNWGSIVLNGSFTGVSRGNVQFGSLASFHIDSGFTPGLNTLTFQVHNLRQVCAPSCGFFSGPSGLLVDHLAGSANPIPEPTTALLVSTGLVGISAINRKRRLSS